MLREEAAAVRWAVSRARWMGSEAGDQHRAWLSWWLVKETRVKRQTPCVCEAVQVKMVII